MAVPEDTIWAIEAHTIAKHNILENYLKAWFPILSKYNGRIVYLDGFAGPGIHSGGEPGSPIIALSVAKNHGARLNGEIVFIFVEERKDRHDRLTVEISKAQSPNHFKIITELGTFKEIINPLLDRLDRENQPLAPTFAFIDPFGFSGVSFGLVQRILIHSKSEVFVNFMVDSMNRFLENPNDKTRDHIVDFFGTPDVQSVASTNGDRKTRLLEFYISRLRLVAKFVRMFEMRNNDGRVIYYLVFATNNPLGHLKMKEAMWKVDGEGDFRYSDATDKDQIVLFKADHSEALFLKIKSRFSGQKMQVKTIREFVHDETVYIDKHLTKALEFGEKSLEIDVDLVKSDGKNRHGKTFPDTVILRIN